MNYSARRDQAPLLRVPLPLSLPPSLPGAGGGGASKKKGKRGREEEDEEEEEEEEEKEEGNEGEEEGGEGRNRHGIKKQKKGGKEGRFEEESEELSLLSQAEARLHLSSSPWSTTTKAASLPCRERETQEVRA
jgi:hypothetical protein